ncbi:hypothetical protein PG993_000219 [Apiospora rasikravindrae]|uniref:Uncharacterized protein n=1 Tax=Apiospora rasikravindrae TaxID=990691 RepID=A0ABR1U7Z0_9PEZI
MAKYINVAHSEHSPNAGPALGAPRDGVRREHYSRFHLVGFSFYHGDPMKINQDVHDFLQKPAFMPWRKSRGDIDSFLRFETTLRVLFEAVVFFQDFWGQRGFWRNLRALLRLDTTVSADTLEDAVKLYCDCRRSCLSKVVKRGEPPSKIAQLADIVIDLRAGEHCPISIPDWEHCEAKWRSKLYHTLCDQGVHSQQVMKGTCAPELRDLSASPRSETQRRDRPELRQLSPTRRPLSPPPRRPRSPPRRPSLDQPKRPRDNEAISGAEFGLPPKPPARVFPKEQGPAVKENTATKPSCEQPNSSTAATSRESSSATQSLDELVATYKDTPASAAMPRKRSRDEQPEEAGTPNKRLATGPGSNSSRPNRPLALPPIETEPPLYENTHSRFEPTSTQDPPAQEPQQEEKVFDPQVEDKEEDDEEVIMDAIEVAGVPEEPSTEVSKAPDQLSCQPDEATTLKVPDRIRSPDAMSESLFVEKTELPTDTEEAAESVDAIRELLLCLEQRQVRLEALESSADSQRKLMEQWAADRKRIVQLEARLNDRSSELGQVRALQGKSTAHGQQLERQLSTNRHLEETMQATAREVKDVQRELGLHISDVERAGEETSKATVQLRRELREKCEADRELFRRFDTSIDGAKKEIADADFQNGLRFAEVERQSQEVERQFKAAEQRLERQWEQRTNAYQDLWERHSSNCNVQRAEGGDSAETRLADLQRQLSQVQEALQAREAAGPPAHPTTYSSAAVSNGLDTGSLPGLDTGTFLDTMYYEMSKLRTAMRTRIRAMDADDVPDEDDAKLAVSDISFELGRVLEVARKRINKL